jgi:hypothetical protein
VGEWVGGEGEREEELTLFVSIFSSSRFSASSESLGEGFLYSMTQFTNDYFHFFVPESPQISAAAESSESARESARERESERAV